MIRAIVRCYKAERKPSEFAANFRTVNRINAES
jgi:hypothetical protein